MRKKTKTVIKKSKVNIPASRVLVFCGCVVIICLCLLLATNIIESRPQETPVSSSVTERFETEKKTPVSERKIEVKTENKAVTKQENKPENRTEIKTEAEKKAAPAVPEKKVPQEVKGPVKTESQKAIESKPVQSVTKPQPVQTGFGFPKANGNAKLVFLLDDGGQNINQLRNFLALPIPFSVAVLPGLPHSKESASLVRQTGNELLLHQPMQAINQNVNPGPGAVKPDMTESEIRMVIEQNLSEIGPVKGMNNHEGSLITADPSTVGIILDKAYEKNIFFLDSRTTVETKIPEVSRQKGYGWYERNGNFLDNQKTRDEFLKQLKKNLDVANRQGSAIMIAHVWSGDYMPALIKEVLPELKEKGYEITTIGKLPPKR